MREKKDAATMPMQEVARGVAQEARRGGDGLNSTVSADSSRFIGLHPLVVHAMIRSAIYVRYLSIRVGLDKGPDESADAGLDEGPGYALRFKI